MTSPKQIRTEKNVGGTIFEELFTEFLKKKYNITPEQLEKVVAEKETVQNSLPVSILCSDKLSSLESIVKFLRENRKQSYEQIGKLLVRHPKTLAVTYNVSRRKMPEKFNDSIDNDTARIPFTVFSRQLSVLECICSYLKSQNNSYADIARMIRKDQRTVWTVCKRAEKKSGKISEKNVEKKKIGYGGRTK